MGAGAFGGQPQEVVTPESLLLDAAERIGRMREGRSAVQIHLSGLLPANREEGRIRIAFRLFEAMINAYRGQIFLLSTSDIMLLCKDTPLADLDAIIFKLRALFATDPLTYAESPEGGDRFVSYYDLEADFDAFFALCGQLAADAKRQIAEKRTLQLPQTLEAGTLAALIERIGTVDIGGIVRRQPCVRVSDRSTADVVFQEFFMSIMDLQKVLAPDVNLLSNRWLFQHLSQVLDLKVVSTLQAAGFRSLPVAFSLNLNMSTVESAVFQQFEAALRGRAGLVVEFQVVDIFNNLDGFFRARDRLREHGHKSLLDGLTPVTLQFLDGELFDTDYLKLSWSGDLTDDIRTAEIHNALVPVGFDRVILSRCDSETAVSWGLSQGIRMFQGRFLDSMIAAVTMARCDKAAACSLAQCTQRHAVIAGRTRGECGNLDMLDLFPPLTTIR